MAKKIFLLGLSLMSVAAQSNEMVIKPETTTHAEPSKYLAIERLHAESIEQTKKSIALDLKKTGIIRAGLNAGITIAALYAVYKIFMERDPINNQQFVYDQNNLVPLDALNIRVTNLENGQAALVNSLNPGWFTWQWCQNWAYTIGRGLMSMVATKGVFDAGEHVYQQVYHQGTIQWFIGSRTKLLELCSELQEYGQKYDNSLPQSSAEKSINNFYANEIASVMNSLMKQCDFIIAFMELSIDSMPQKSRDSIEAKALTTYLQFMVNNFANSIENKINNQLQIAPTISQFTADFGRTMMSFNRIEKPIDF